MFKLWQCDQKHPLMAPHPIPQSTTATSTASAAVHLERTTQDVPAATCLPGANATVSTDSPVHEALASSHQLRSTDTGIQQLTSNGQEPQIYWRTLTRPTKTGLCASRDTQG